MTVPESFFRRHPRVAVALSGGVDSSVVLHLALANGADAVAVFVRTPLTQQSDEDAVTAVCGVLGIVPEIVDVDVLSIPEVAGNAADRCYHCKRAIFSRIIRMHPDRSVLDGTNASDDLDDRPGFRALGELGVESPLRLFGMTKSAVRDIARSAGLPNWNRPSESCVATRFPTGTTLTGEGMERVRCAEAVLSGMGFSGFRVHDRVDTAELWFDPSQMDMAKADLEGISSGLSDLYAIVRIAGERKWC